MAASSKKKKLCPIPVHKSLSYPAPHQKKTDVDADNNNLSDPTIYLSNYEKKSQKKKKSVRCMYYQLF